MMRYINIRFTLHYTCEKSRQVTANAEIHGKRQKSRLPLIPCVNSVNSRIVHYGDAVALLQVLVHSLPASRRRLVQRRSRQAVDSARQPRYAGRLHAELRDDNAQERTCQRHRPRRRQLVVPRARPAHLARCLQREHQSRGVHNVVQLLDTGERLRASTT